MLTAAGSPFNLSNRLSPNTHQAALHSDDSSPSASPTTIRSHADRKQQQIPAFPQDLPIGQRQHHQQNHVKLKSALLKPSSSSSSLILTTHSPATKSSPPSIRRSSPASSSQNTNAKRSPALAPGKKSPAAISTTSSPSTNNCNISSTNKNEKEKKPKNKPPKDFVTTVRDLTEMKLSPRERKLRKIAREKYTLAHQTRNLSLQKKESELYHRLYLESLRAEAAEGDEENEVDYEDVEDDLLDHYRNLDGNEEGVLDPYAQASTADPQLDRINQMSAKWKENSNSSSQSQWGLHDEVDFEAEINKWRTRNPSQPAGQVPTRPSLSIPFEQVATAAARRTSQPEVGKLGKANAVKKVKFGVQKSDTSSAPNSFQPSLSLTPDYIDTLTKAIDTLNIHLGSTSLVNTDPEALSSPTADLNTPHPFLAKIEHLLSTSLPHFLTNHLARFSVLSDQLRETTELAKSATTKCAELEKELQKKEEEMGKLKVEMVCLRKETMERVAVIVREQEGVRREMAGVGLVESIRGTLGIYSGGKECGGADMAGRPKSDLRGRRFGTGVSW
ncbi:hypothetical protein HDV05_004722 [Chytridiales sp. JEL 0842]|nr:hypothetical protein HDV05_004722 [Chytridiales sp. JEL 0842]